MSSIYTK